MIINLLLVKDNQISVIKINIKKMLVKLEGHGHLKKTINSNRL